MAGTQRPLQTLPESPVLGVRAHPEPINVFVCGAQDVGKTALIVRVSLPVGNPPPPTSPVVDPQTPYLEIAYITSTA